MEKSGQSVNYPRMPTEMQEDVATGSQAPTGPPSYEQATHTTPYPPVQVQSTPSANEAMKHPQTQQTTAPIDGAHTQNHSYQGASTQYGATNMGGYGSGGGVPPTHYMYNASATSQPLTQQPVVIIQQHAMLPLGPDPTTITCPNCHIQKLTRVNYEPSARTHLMAAILCIVGLWCCVCLPYCAESCMSANHYCGNCNKFLGTYNGGGF